MNPLVCISINHKKAPLNIRERIRIDAGDILELMDVAGDTEAYTLNTCNRSEVYAIGIDADDIFLFINRLSGVDIEDLKLHAEVFTGKNAIAHLFMVASGLDSLVIGEAQILGQIKDSYRDSLAAGTTSIYLNKALHRAFRAAKRVRTQTDIGKFPVSVASEAVELACHIFEDISKNSVLIIGAGDMASIAGKRLKDRGVKSLCIINRTRSVACDLAEELGGTPKPFDALYEELIRCDIVISSTGSTSPIITTDMVEKVMKQRRNAPIIIIDIAVPRDVESSAGKCYNCYLYDIDALKSIVEKNFANRQQQMDKAASIIADEVEAFGKWRKSLNAQATIKDLYGLMEDHIQQLIGDIDLAAAQKSMVEQALRTSIRRFLHRPVSFLKENPGINYIEHTRRIFRLDEDYTDRHKG